MSKTAMALAGPVLLLAEKEIPQCEKLFSNRKIRQMIIPLFIEQILVVFVGMADTFMVSFVGEAAISGVALVDQFNLIFLYLSIALGAGGAVIVSQYLGAGQKGDSCRAAGQMLACAVLLSLIAAAAVWLFHVPLLDFLFGSVADDVMAAAVAYLVFTVFSYPALGIYNAGAAVQRSLGNTQLTMQISAASNVINIAGNIIGIFVLHAGIAGVAVPTVLARWFSALAITAVTFAPTRDVFYRWQDILTFDGIMLRRILGVAVPNAVESGFFQLMKVGLTSIIALFGTQQIAANGVAQSIWSVAAMFGVTMGYVYITVIGRCMGAGLREAADYYFRKLSRLTLALATGWNLLVLVAAACFLSFYPLAEETRHLVFLLVLIHNICNALFFSFSQPLASGLRAAGDVKVTMWVTVFATICRVVLAVIFGIYLGLGVIGVALAMCMDWLIRAVLMIGRWQSGKWKSRQLI